MGKIRNNKLASVFIAFAMMFTLTMAPVQEVFAEEFNQVVTNLDNTEATISEDTVFEEAVVEEGIEGKNEDVEEEQQSTNEIKIFHTNDVHSRVDNYSKVAAYINNYSGNKLVLDMGDTFHGQSFATLENGSSIAKILKAMGYTALVPGNHDFNYGQDRLRELGLEAGIEILASNIKKNGSPAYGEYMIKDVNGIKVGLFGVASPETAYKTNQKNVTGIDFGTLDSIVADSQKIVNTLKAEGANVIIALSHLGIDKTSDVKATDVAAAVNGIDVMLDGHSHSTLPEYEEFNANNETKITSTGQYLNGLGEVTLSLDENNEVIDVELSVIDTNILVEEDATIKALIDDIKAAQQPILDVKVGQTTILLDGLRANVRGGHTNLGRLLTSAILDETGADIAFTNGGGIRDSIQVGDITKGDVIKVLPFGNYIVTKKVKGQDIIDALNFGMVDQSGGFPHFAGMIVESEKYADEAGKVRWRVISAKVNGEALDLNKEYVLATNDFTAVGGDGYEMLKKYPTLNEYSALDEALINYIAKVGDEGIVAIDKEQRLIEVDSAVIAVEELINNLSKNITLGDKEAVEAARAAYEALTEEQKALVFNLDVLIAAEEKILELEELNKLPEDDLELNDDVTTEVMPETEKPLPEEGFEPEGDVMPMLPQTGGQSLIIFAVIGLVAYYWWSFSV